VRIGGRVCGSGQRARALPRRAKRGFIKLAACLQGWERCGSVHGVGGRRRHVGDAHRGEEAKQSKGTAAKGLGKTRALAFAATTACDPHTPALLLVLLPTAFLQRLWVHHCPKSAAPHTTEIQPLSKMMMLPWPGVSRTADTGHGQCHTGFTTLYVLSKLCLCLWGWLGHKRKTNGDLTVASRRGLSPSGNRCRLCFFFHLLSNAPTPHTQESQQQQWTSSSGIMAPMPLPTKQAGLPPASTSSLHSLPPPPLHCC
jgi:hypothetical protein